MADVMADVDVTVEPTSTVEHTADGLADHEAKHYRQICVREKEVARLKAEFNDTREVAKEAKKAYEAEADALHALIHRGPDPQKRLPGIEEGEVEANPEADVQEAEERQWREIPLADLKIPAGTLGKLAEAGLETIGALADWQQEKGEFWAVDIAGIGPKAAVKIEEVLLAAWGDFERDRHNPAGETDATEG
uniref:Uncharacterized protein n=1 Tax=viral metagenome TaxID=1070528 RepID=A0A6M3L2T4_9ZZZZ